MADVLILEFEGFGEDVYRSVNDELGIDMQSGEGDWPDGLLSHTGAATADGFLVFEVWASQEDQERFQEERLNAALQAGGAQGPPKRADWLDLSAHHTPGA